MPVHDWTRVDAGIFHDFHQAWTIAIRNALNSGGLPDGYYAMAEQILGGPIPDVIALREPPRTADGPRTGGVAIAENPPRARFQRQAQSEAYAARANGIAIRHRLGDVVAMIEIISPGNKSNRHALRKLLEKTRELLEHGINLLVVDLFPPTVRDPQGIHKAIWDEIVEEPFELPADKQLTVASYLAGDVKTALIEPFAVGDVLPEMPIFLSPETYVPAPLEATYQSTWAVSPRPVRDLLTADSAM